jgi:hypothetical protein
MLRTDCRSILPCSFPLIRLRLTGNELKELEWRKKIWSFSNPRGHDMFEAMEFEVTGSYTIRMIDWRYALLTF